MNLLFKKIYYSNDFVTKKQKFKTPPYVMLKPMRQHFQIQDMHTLLNSININMKKTLKMANWNGFHFTTKIHSKLLSW